MRGKQLMKYVKALLIKIDVENDQYLIIKKDKYEVLQGIPSEIKKISDQFDNHFFEVIICEP